MEEQGTLEGGGGGLHRKLAAQPTEISRPASSSLHHTIAGKSNSLKPEAVTAGFVHLTEPRHIIFIGPSFASNATDSPRRYVNTQQDL